MVLHYIFFTSRPAIPQFSVTGNSIWLTSQPLAKALAEPLGCLAAIFVSREDSPSCESCPPVG